MIRRSTFILLLLFLVLAVLAIAFQQTWFEKEEVEPTPIVQPKLLEEFPLENLFLLQVSENNQISLELTKQSDGNWAISIPAGTQTDDGKIERLLTTLYDLTPTGTVSVDTALEALGISPESSKILLENTSGESLVLHIGTLTPTSSGYFLQVNNKPAVVVSKYGLQELISLLQPESLLSTNPTP